MKSDLALSAAQLGVWYALKAGASTSSYNISDYKKIAGAIDRGLFEAALRHVVVEAEALRLRFTERDGVPSQLIAPPPDWSMTYQDVSTEADPISAAEAWMHTDMARPFDLSNGPLFAFALFKAAPDEFLWYERYHHLVMDGAGASLIGRRVAEVYSALCAGLNIDCAPFGSLAALAQEDAAYRASEHFKSDRQFWLDSMSDCPEPLSLSPSPSPSTSALFLHKTAKLPSATVAQLQDFARRTQTTIPQVATAAAAIFIHRLTEAEDVVLGQFLAVRMTAASRQTPAMVSNVVPLRLAIQPAMRVEELVAQVRRKARALIRHQRYRIADIRRDLRRIAKPIFGQSISIRPFDYNLQFAGFPSTTHGISNGPVDDLNIHIVYDQSESGEFLVEFDANPALYNTDCLARLQLRFLRLLAAMDDPAEIIGRLDILPPDERRQILVAWNKTTCDYPRNRQVHELFEEQARRTPDRVAVICEQEQLTYLELNEQADRLADQLSLLGVGPDQRVGLYVERSLGMVVGLLGILKAGSAYVPLDPNYPRDRLTFILDDSQPLVLLTQQSLRDRLRPKNVRTLYLDALPNLPTDTGAMRSTSERQTGDLAYVLYTSGSTGQPKGVQIPHRALVNFLKAMEREPGITAEDRLLSVTSLSFDIAGLELLLPLMVGAQVVIAPNDVIADGFRLAMLMKERDATIMQATPATWRLLLEAGWNGSQRLKILCGGEAWSSELAHALLPRCASLWNMYGPTETTVWSSVARIEGDQRVLMGPPIANTTFYVLDAYSQPVPVGVAGELYIGGDGVALGYLNRPELTQERFVVDRFSDQSTARMYKTGDHVRFLPDGRLEFLGRLDHQVKIRGHRVELGEIEAVLRLHPDVKDAVVVEWGNGEGEKRLVGYVTVSVSKPVSISGMRDLLRQKLPPYMMPAALVPLAAFPLTPNGKVDRKALPIPSDEVRRDVGESYVLPRTPLEELLAGFWRDLLHLKRVSIHDNFFDLGGDSLSMLRLSLEIERATGQRFPLTWINDAPTVAGMAEILSGTKSASSYAPLVLLRPGSDAPPVFIVHPVGGGTAHLIPLARSLPGAHPVYGVQAKGLDGTHAPNDRVEAMAECYVSAITELQPRGPYLLVGNCFGGLVAVEIARRLLERGDSIGLLAFLDTYPHPRYWPLGLRANYFLIHRIKEHWLALSEARRHEIVPYITTRLSILFRKFVALVSGTHSFLKAPNSLPPAIKTVYESGIAALVSYHPRYYPGKVSYLMCGYHAYLPHGPTSVWTNLVAQLEVESVPTDAAGVVSVHAEHVAKWLSDRIRDAT